MDQMLNAAKTVGNNGGAGATGSANRRKQWVEDNHFTDVTLGDNGSVVDITYNGNKWDSHSICELLIKNSTGVMKGTDKHKDDLIRIASEGEEFVLKFEELYVTKKTERRDWSETHFVESVTLGNGGIESVVINGKTYTEKDAMSLMVDKSYGYIMGIDNCDGRCLIVTRDGLDLREQ